MKIMWIPHEGGACPVPDGTKVDVKYRDGVVVNDIPAMEGVDTHPRDASHAFWEHDRVSADIVAYRLCEDAQPVVDATMHVMFFVAGNDHKIEVTAKITTSTVDKILALLQGRGE